MNNGVYETTGDVVETPDGVIIKTHRPAVDDLSDQVRVIWSDGRYITPEQRRKLYALMGEISEATGYTPDETKAIIKATFLSRTLDEVQHRCLSFADCSVSEARACITLCIDLILDMGIPTRVPLIQLCDDLARYTYACLMHKACVVCQKKADLHHVDHVGMGYDRREICHLGMRCLPLCREHHMLAHSVGESRFEETFHLEPVKIDDRICKLYKLGGSKNA